MNLLLYLKAVIGAVGAGTFPPIAEWLVALVLPHAPNNVQFALASLLVALATGGVVYLTPNKPADALRSTTA